MGDFAVAFHGRLGLFPRALRAQKLYVQAGCLARGCVVEVFERGERLVPATSPRGEPTQVVAMDRVEIVHGRWGDRIDLSCDQDVEQVYADWVAGLHAVEDDDSE